MTSVVLRILQVVVKPEGRTALWSQEESGRVQPFLKLIWFTLQTDEHRLRLLWYIEG